MGGFWSSVASIIPGVKDTQQHRRNKREAQKDRDFQERMSSSAYQRGAKDMEDAGLNPALMYGGGASSASTPGGSKADIDKGTGGVVSSALQAKQVLADIERVKQQTRQQKALSDREEATNFAYGLTRDAQGRLVVPHNTAMPNLMDQIQAQVGSSVEQWRAAQYSNVGLRNIASVQGSMAGGPLTSAQQLMSALMGRQLVTRAARGR